MDGLTEICEWLGVDRVREAAYGAPGQPQVYYEDGNTYGDVTDLYSVLEQERENGTPNLENAQVENLGSTILSGRSLSDVQIGVLQKLMAKYARQIEALRAKSDHDGQDYTHGPDPGTARLVIGG